ncbi:MAG: hypothetical protein D6791_11960 [Chloroflexi bacterium]|nr:MAG: hypothetical protein D6791_11960 [Chloroflexota bacterium]
MSRKQKHAGHADLCDNSRNPIQQKMNIRRIRTGEIIGLILLLLCPPMPGAAGLGDFAAGPEKTSSTSNIPSLAPIPEQTLQKFATAGTLDELFERVRTGVRFEPYQGLLRGAAGTAQARRGNALDQALLLKRILDAQGYRTRLVEGKLSEANTRVLLRGMYPPRLPETDFDATLSPFDLDANPVLQQIVQPHYWVEVEQVNGTWLPLDPAFPRARIGEAYARASARYAQPAEEWQHRIALRLLLQTADGRTDILFQSEASVADWAYLPISAACLAIPLEAPAEQQGGSAAGLFGGALSGRTNQAPPKAQPPDIRGTRYRWSLSLPGVPAETRVYDVLASKPETAIVREWLEVTLKGPDGRERKVERTLYEPVGKSDRPADYRRHLLLVLPGAVRPDLTEAVQRQLADLPLKEWEASSAHRPAPEVFARDEVLGTSVLQALLVRFAAASDEAIDRAGLANGILPLRTTPRLLIASVEKHADQPLTIQLDLRLDEVDALPFPGVPVGLVRLFRLGRGIAESVLEGEVWSSVAQQEVATTAHLMKKATEQGIPLKVVNGSSVVAFIARTGMPKSIAKRLKAGLTNGAGAVVPERAVRIAGRDRWGWWQIDPSTGRTVGVMDNGLHGAMVEYGLASKDIGLHPKLGFALGMVTGANSTLFTIAGLLLEEGIVTAALIEKAKAMLSDLLCHSCPRAEAATSYSHSVEGFCLSKNISALSAGAKAEFDFCDEYVKGFQCAVGILLGGLKLEQVTEKMTIGTGYEYGCTKESVESERKIDY